MQNQGSHRARVLAVAAFTLVATVRPSGGTRADDNGRGARPTIDALAWITGDWRADQGDNLLQEHWGGPLADSMTAMFRWIRGGKLWMTEHITIVAEGDRITYRFRHFSRDLSAWEEKNDPLTFDLISVRDGHAVFENPNPPPKRPKRIVYTRDGDTLTVRLEGATADEPDVFVFRRHQSANAD